MERMDEECLGHRLYKKRVGIVPVPLMALCTVFAAFTVCLSARIYQVSGRGSPTQPEFRKGIGRLFACMVFVKPLVLAILTGWGIYGVAYLNSRLKCIGHVGRKPYWYYLCITVVSFQCFEVLIYAIFLYFWIKWELKHKIKPKGKSALMKTERKAEDWDRRCKCCCKYTSRFCCFSFGGRGIQDEDFSSAAWVLAELFTSGGTLDIVASDVIIAFMAIGIEQEEEKQRCIERLKAEAGDDLASLALLEQATTSNAVPISRPLKALLKAAMARDIEAGMSSDSASLTAFLNATSVDNERGDRRSSLLFKGCHNEDGENFAIRELLSPAIHEDRYAIAEGARFLRNSIAINTTKGYLFNDLSKNCCRLAFARCCELPKYRRQGMGRGEIVGKGRIGMNEAAFMKVIGFDESKVELHYANFRNTVDEGVYCILADHVWKSVVICIRGSLSLEDYVVNLQVDPQELDEIGDEYGFDEHGEYCHAGYLARAIWICEDIKRHGILDGLLDKESGKHPEYTLRVTGHSLGAGTAAPLALMLRSQYPDLRCLCFAPPGGLFSEGLATRCQSYITTYVLNADLVPRISTRTLEHMRDEVLQMIARIKVPKKLIFEINRSGKKLSESPFGLKLKDLLHDADTIPESDFKADLNRFEQREKKNLNISKIPLHPPGKFIHLVKTMSSQEQRIFQQGRFMPFDLFNCFTCDKFVAEDKYAPRYAVLSDFDDIVISSTLISDHMIEAVELAFFHAAEAFGVDPSGPPPAMTAER